MKPTVYLETTVISYLAASPSRDIVVAAHQQITRDWWDRRDRVELFVSQAVLDEASRGDTGAAARRRALLLEIPVLTVSDEVIEFAGQLLQGRVVPAKAHPDAIHIAMAAVNRIAYLVTWNCAHIANAAVRGKIESACRAAGLPAPIICTPEELMEA
jgi:predicted nucleic acid-binding protein